MNKIGYPFNNSEQLRKRKSIKRLLSEKLGRQPRVLKIAILGGATMNVLGEILEIYLLQNGYEIELYYSDFSRYYEEIVFGTGNLWNFDPDYILIHTTFRDLKDLPITGNGPDEVERKLNAEFAKITQMWTAIKEKSNAIIIQNNFEFPRLRLLGNSANTENFGLVRFVNMLNLQLSDSIKSNVGIVLNDLNYLSAQFGLESWFNESQWINYKYAYEVNACWSVASSLANIIHSILGNSKKCLILDLDNTLWGGVIGDDGLGGICLGSESAQGESFISFQKYILQLKERGVLLAICSKNDLEIARSGFGHSDSVLQLDDFAVFKASWRTKEEMIREIASELNIGLNSLVFIDDNPAERQLVKMSLPMVEVPEIGENVLDYPRFIESNGYFESIKVVQEDLFKHRVYQENKQRAVLAASILDYNEYLLSLKMIAEFSRFRSNNVDRIVQLINKTNQFNLTNLKIDVNKVTASMNNPNYFTLQARLLDIFGDNGIVSLFIGNIIDDTLSIDLWVMSCRVFKRNLEHAIMDEVIHYCKKQNIKTIVGRYNESGKNKIVAKLYLDFGFKEQDSNTFIFDLRFSNIKFNQVIEISHA
ncbi:MAG: HAD-IIIC family phosphatase [Bacteriovorax sp.]|nr:HAD-IIIC family phosphatase [Bacteriovorax sp.]